MLFYAVINEIEDTVFNQCISKSIIFSIAIDGVSRFYIFSGFSTRT